MGLIRMRFHGYSAVAQHARGGMGRIYFGMKKKSISLTRKLVLCSVGFCVLIPLFFALLHNPPIHRVYGPIHELILYEKKDSRPLVTFRLKIDSLLGPRPEVAFWYVRLGSLNLLWCVNSVRGKTG